MVEPLRDKPGMTAKACATPIHSAERQVTLPPSSPAAARRSVSISDKKRRPDVKTRAPPTTTSPSPKRTSTWSLKNMPTTNTGTIDRTISRR